MMKYQRPNQSGLKFPRASYGFPKQTQWREYGPKLNKNQSKTKTTRGVEQSKGNTTEATTFFNPCHHHDSTNNIFIIFLITKLKKQKKLPKSPFSLRVHRTLSPGPTPPSTLALRTCPTFFTLALFPLYPATHVFSSTLMDPTIITLFFLGRPETVEENNNNQRNGWILVIPTWRYLVGTITWHFIFFY